MKLLYSDAHCHSNPVEGLGARRIARRFKKVGGWFIALVGLPPYHYGFSELTIDSYRKALDLVIREANTLRDEGIRTSVFFGFHPAEVDHFFKVGWELERIISFAEEVFKLVTRYHSEGLIDGLGEVGRQHYSTAPARLVASEIILMKAMEVAKDNNLFMHLHLEQGGYVTVESIDRLIKCIGVSREKIFLHHASYNEAVYAEERGFWYTIPAKRRIYEKVLRKTPVHVLTESDFIDDPRRPGVSSYPWDIPARLSELVAAGIVDEEYVYKIEVDNIVRAYDVEAP